MSNTKTLVHRQWHGDLVAYLRPIVWCEKCGTTNQVPPLQHAHRLKRDFIGYKTEADHDEYMMAAKLCQTCHQGYDENFNRHGIDGFDAHQIMYDEITELCNKREFDIHVA